jgi:hypothetical protein
MLLWESRSAIYSNEHLGAALGDRQLDTLAVCIDTFIHRCGQMLAGRGCYILCQGGLSRSERGHRRKHEYCHRSHDRYLNRAECPLVAGRVRRDAPGPLAKSCLISVQLDICIYILFS